MSVTKYLLCPLLYDILAYYDKLLSRLTPSSAWRTMLHYARLLHLPGRQTSSLQGQFQVPPPHRIFKYMNKQLTNCQQPSLTMAHLGMINGEDADVNHH